MGTTQSKRLKAGTVNKIINDAIIKHIPKTVSSNTAINYLRVDDGGRAINNTQIINVISNIESISTLSQQVDFQTDLQNEIIQQLEDKSVALLSDIKNLFSNSDINIKTFIDNSVKNLSLTEVLPLCSSDSQFVNKIIVGKGAIAKDNVQEITADIYVQCITNTDSTVNTISELINDVNQKVELDENPFSFIGDAVSDVANNFIWIAAAAIAVVILVLLLSSIFSKKNKQSYVETVPVNRYNT